MIILNILFLSQVGEEDCKTIVTNNHKWAGEGIACTHKCLPCVCMISREEGCRHIYLPHVCMTSGGEGYRHIYLQCVCMTSGGGDVDIYTCHVFV